MCMLPLLMGGPKAALGAAIGGLPGALIGRSMGQKPSGPNAWGMMPPNAPRTPQTFGDGTTVNGGRS